MLTLAVITKGVRDKSNEARCSVKYKCNEFKLYILLICYNYAIIEVSLCCFKGGRHATAEGMWLKQQVMM